jgi:hypothetical protein
MSGSNSEKIGCGTVLLIVVLIIVALGALGAPTTLGGR